MNDEAYFFAITAFDNEGLESAFSNEESYLAITSPQEGFYVNATNYTSYAISGVAPAGGLVEVFSGITSLGLTTALADRTWKLNVDFSPLDEGERELFFLKRLRRF